MDSGGENRAARAKATSSAFVAKCMAELLLWTNGVGARSVWLQERATVEPSSNVTSQSYLGVRANAV